MEAANVTESAVFSPAGIKSQARLIKSFSAPPIDFPARRRTGSGGGPATGAVAPDLRVVIVCNATLPARPCLTRRPNLCEMRINYRSAARRSQYCRVRDGVANEIETVPSVPRI